MIERSFFDIPYFAVVRSYSDGATAKRAFERLDAAGRKAKGKLDLGVYRLVPHGIGEPTVIAIVSLGRKGVEFAERVMGGEETDIVTGRELDALLARRARVVEQIRDSGQMKEGGSLAIRRPEGRGGRLRADGEIEEQIGEG